MAEVGSVSAPASKNPSDVSLILIVEWLKGDKVEDKLLTPSTRLFNSVGRGSLSTSSYLLSVAKNNAPWNCETFSNGKGKIVHFKDCCFGTK